MPRLGDHLGGRPGLDDLAGVEDHDPVADLGDDGEVVGDQQQRQAALLAQLPEQFQHLGLDGRVEGGGGLVRDHPTVRVHAQQLTII